MAFSIANDVSPDDRHISFIQHTHIPPPTYIDISREVPDINSGLHVLSAEDTIPGV